MRSALPRAFAVASLLSLLSLSPLFAQASLPLLGDASTPPRGMFRLHVASSWARSDARYVPGGTAPLGALFTADSLGVRQIPRLAPAESLVQSASGIPFSLTLGRSRLDAAARTEVIPLTLEYGLTNRFSVGVMMPVVRKRLAVQFRLDTAGGFAANVGPNQHRTNPAAAANNATVQAQFASAAEQLQARLAACQANPSGPGCAALLAREAEAQALIGASTGFAQELALIYGSAGGSGQPFVPAEQSDAQLAIVARIAAFNAQYRDLLSAGTDLLTALPFGAGGPAGVADLRAYFASDEGQRDSIATQERVGIGDVEVGFRFLVVDRRTADGIRGVQLAVASALRLPTGSRQSPSEIADLRLGAGDRVVDARAVLDATSGRFGVIAAARFETALSPEESDPGIATVLPFRDRSLVEASAAPRWHLSRALSVHGAWALRSGDESGSLQLAGGGIAFSGFSSTTAGRTPPVEMRFTHLETISGGVGQPRFFRDQIELRIYYRLRR